MDGVGRPSDTIIMAVSRVSEGLPTLSNQHKNILILGMVSETIENLILMHKLIRIHVVFLHTYLYFHEIFLYSCC